MQLRRAALLLKSAALALAVGKVSLSPVQFWVNSMAMAGPVSPAVGKVSQSPDPDGEVLCRRKLMAGNLAHWEWVAGLVVAALYWARAAVGASSSGPCPACKQQVVERWVYYGPVEVFLHCCPAPVSNIVCNPSQTFKVSVRSDNCR